MSSIVTIKEYKQKKKPPKYFYQCECMKGQKDPEDGKEYYSVFYLDLDGYECAHCEKIHTFEDVHGSLGDL